MLSSEERIMSSTWRELKAIYYSLLSFLPLLKGQNVHWFSDNQSSISVVKFGSRKPHLQKLAPDVFSLCLNNISIYLEWIPRNLNEIADAISKFLNYDDWRTTDGFFTFLNKIWGPFTINRFASAENKKLERFNSLFWNPGTERVNAFSTSWEYENNWLVPPIYLISNTILHLLTCQAQGTLIVPRWTSAPFWPLLFINKLQTQPYVVDLLLSIDIFEFGNYKESLLGLDSFTSSVLALKLDGSYKS